MTALAPEPVAAAAGDGDDLSHAACPCYPNIALCGADVSGLPWADDDEVPTDACVVCLDLEDQICPRCGQ